LGIAAAVGVADVVKEGVASVNVGGGRASTAAVNMTNKAYDLVTGGFYSTMSTGAASKSMGERIDTSAQGMTMQFYNKSLMAGNAASPQDLRGYLRAALTLSSQQELARNRVSLDVSTGGAQAQLHKDRIRAAKTGGMIEKAMVGFENQTRENMIQVQRDVLKEAVKTNAILNKQNQK
jgi:hypothetical protein